ncbi:hypothetical protein [Affinibrenneria salicis]|nr:hypothetical protein [Affinibrenneria salicis]
MVNENVIDRGKGMVTKPLSNELISLINYVELNKSGWWKKATSQVILGFLWECDEKTTLLDLHDKISKELNLSIPVENVSSQIEYLLSSGKILKSDNKFYLTESQRQDLNNRNKLSIEEDVKVESLFKNLLLEQIETDEPEVYWNNFKEELVKSIRKIGANTYTFLKDGRLHKYHDWLDGFLNKYDSDIHHKLVKVLSGFFNPSIDCTRSYILRLLNAHFFVEATQLKKDTIKILEKTRKNKDVKIVLDTNFVFSILGLHENPADESATSLLSLSEKVGCVKINYYILPTTLEEIRKVVSYEFNNLKRYRYSPHIAKAAVKSGLRSSIAAKYFAKCAKSSGELSLDAYFLPYTDGLLKNLSSKGIKILEWPTIQYPTDERVVNDQVTLWEKEEKKPENKRKRYEAIEHDLIFWYIIKDHRTDHAESALDENYWGVTIDWSMISFDQVKRRTKKSDLPVVLHPTNLVQLLQFWIPRDEILESGILETMRLPLLFGQFDEKDEKLTIELIQALSTYKNIDDIDIDILSSMLADKALKQRISDSDHENDLIIEIIESEFAEKATKYKSELDSRMSEVEKANAVVTEKDMVINDRQLEINRKNSEIESLKSQIEAFETDKMIASKERKQKIFFVFLYFFLPLMIIICSYKLLIPEIKDKYHLDGVLELIVAGILSYFIFIFFSVLANVHLEKIPSLNKWLPIRISKKLVSKIIAPLVVSIVSFKDEIAELIKNLN